MGRTIAGVFQLMYRTERIYRAIVDQTGEHLMSSTTPAELLRQLAKNPPRSGITVSVVRVVITEDHERIATVWPDGGIDYTEQV